jgi:hypothetical protein
MAKRQLSSDLPSADLDQFRVLTTNQPLSTISKVQSGKRGSKSAAAANSTGAPESQWSTLVKQDGLVVRVLSHQLPHDRSPSDVESRVDAFRELFSSVWLRIAVNDRAAMLDYWRRNGRSRVVNYPDPPPRFVPVIQFIDLGAGTPQSPAIEKFGHRLNFTASLLAEPRAGSMIADTLARAYHYATGEHFRLFTKVVDEPYEQWEKRMAEKVTETQCDKKWGQLSGVYQRQLQVAITKTIQRWGWTGSGPRRPASTHSDNRTSCDLPSPSKRPSSNVVAQPNNESAPNVNGPSRHIPGKPARLPDGTARAAPGGFTKGRRSARSPSNRMRNRP